jgi:hypothetical protein
MIAMRNSVTIAGPMTTAVNFNFNGTASVTVTAYHRRIDEAGRHRPLRSNAQHAGSGCDDGRRLVATAVYPRYSAISAGSAAGAGFPLKRKTDAIESTKTIAQSRNTSLYDITAALSVTIP